MRTRTRYSLLVIAALVASALGSLAAVATTAGTAEACSIAGPYGEVRPSADLKPGQRVEIAGWGFYDLQLHEPHPQRVAPPDDDNGDLPELCDFDLSPMANLDVYWRGTTSAWLGMVSGPDFTTTVVVPPEVLPGPATITVGPVELAVFVGQRIATPPSCPLTLQPDGTAHQLCPEPWPCPLPAGSGYTASGGTQPAPDADHAPGFLPPCPEPCVDAAHTIDDGTVYDYRWDCPDPCSPIQADPGAFPPDRAVWCPPPDPCLDYTTSSAIGPDGLTPWCPPPDPCRVYLTGESVDVEAHVVSCPDPCPVYAADAVAARPDQAVWCPPPDPCPVYVNSEQVDTEAHVVSCPDPCGSVGGDAVWCPPPDPCPLPALSTNDDPTQSEGLPWCPPVPCHLVGGDALVCPEVETSVSDPEFAPSAEISVADPAPSPASASAAPASVAGTTPAADTGAVETTSAESPAPAAAVVAAPPAPAPPTPREPALTDTSRAASDLVAVISQRIARIVGAIVASILG